MVLFTARFLTTIFLAFTAVSIGSALPGDEPTSGFISDYLMQIDEVQKHILSLENAIPEEKFGWRPAEGVRSISEVYLHIAFGNYLLLKFQGTEPPADVASMIDVMKVNEWDTSTKEKSAIADRLTKSFEHLRSVASQMSEGELEKTADFFGQTVTKRNMLLSCLSHLHEHLGQSIAYARMNGVVPPWTAAQQQQESGK